AGLDPVQIRETLTLIRELGESRTILLSTHILSEIEAVCGRIMIIHRGRLSSDKKMTDLAGAGPVLVEGHGPAEQVVNVLRTTDGVDQVRQKGQGEGIVTCEVMTHNQKDLREAIAQRLARNGWNIRRLEQRARSLEQHFMEIVSHGDGVEGRAG